MQVLHVGKPEAHAQNVHPHGRTREQDGVKYKHKSGHDGQYNEPEPQEDVNLLVDDIERHDAQGVVSLQVGGRSILLEAALGYPGEDPNHGINPVLWVRVDEVDYLESIVHELPIEEPIHEEHLSDDVHEGKYFADEVPPRVPIVRLPAGHEIVHQELFLLLLLRFSQHTDVQVHHEGLDLSALPHAPQPPGHVEEGGLQKQHEAHPLVVFVVAELALVLGRVNTRMRDIFAHLNRKKKRG
ncbi:putative secreted protein [Trichonephila inaurata madagascariensis]|uniref:Putative secreted protein n=1 Tax=Trichonephila inaurata madagascariensis TaxID=2747483 RepID=A0A8X6JHI2_9ARAC|nr:putative secreted protein [Trichonephila inaurata madagascariensis]